MCMLPLRVIKFRLLYLVLRLGTMVLLLRFRLFLMSKIY